MEDNTGLILVLLAFGLVAATIEFVRGAVKTIRKYNNKEEAPRKPARLTQDPWTDPE